MCVAPQGIFLTSLTIVCVILSLVSFLILSSLLWVGHQIVRHPSNSVKHETIPIFLRLFPALVAFGGSPIASHAQWKSQRKSARQKTALPTDGLSSTSSVISTSWEVPLEEILLRGRIKRGAFATVFRGEWAGLEVAVKVLRETADEQTRERFRQEAKIMAKLQHPNVVMFLGSSTTTPKMCLLMERAEGGDLHDYIYGKAGTSVTYSASVNHKFLVDTCRGMRYLHDRANIIHGDLKPQNLLVDSFCNVKICDFGTSIYKSEVKEPSPSSSPPPSEWRGGQGTPYWTAPELMKGERPTKKADVFSFAIIIFELVHRKGPYDSEEKHELEIAHAVAHEGLRPTLSIDSLYSNLMLQAWSENLQKRPSFSDMLQELHEMYRTHQSLHSSMRLKATGTDDHVPPKPPI